MALPRRDKDDVTFLQIGKPGEEPNPEKMIGIIHTGDVPTGFRFIIFPRNMLKGSKFGMVLAKYANKHSNRKVNINECKIATFANDSGAFYFVIYDEKSHLFNGVIGLSTLGTFNASRYDLRFGGRTIVLTEGKVVQLSTRKKRQYEKMVTDTTGLWCPWILPYKQKIKEYACNLPKKCERCEKCKSDKLNLWKCAACEKVYYCSRHCQKIHWKYEHRHQCRKLYSC